MPATTSAYVRLDERHAREQDQIGQPRFEPGDYIVEIVRCYAVDGDLEIWAPETSVTYFVVEARVLSVLRGKTQGKASWVNRLRFNGPAQMKEFLVEALEIEPSRHDEIDEDDCETVVGTTNPLARVRLRLRVEEPKGSGYMHHRWNRLDDTMKASMESVK